MTRPAAAFPAEGARLVSDTGAPGWMPRVTGQELGLVLACSDLAVRWTDVIYCASLSSCAGGSSPGDSPPPHVPRSRRSAWRVFGVNGVVRVCGGEAL